MFHTFSRARQVIFALIHWINSCMLGREDEDSNTANDTSNLYPEYNAYVMNPLKANASASCFWELELLRHHFHPSVAIFASKMLNVCEIPPYSGNALKDFSLASFLETFSQRKPKTGVVCCL